MKKNILKVCKATKTIIEKAKPYVFAFAMASMMYLPNVAFAAGRGGTDIFEVIVKVLGVFCLAGAALQGITGAIAYAEAKADGEGPAMAKAENKIKAAVFLGILGASLSLGAKGLAGMINDNIAF